MSSGAKATTSYDDFLDSIAAGHPGTSIENYLIDLGGGEGDYTVYWPRDSIRVITSASYAVARTVMCILKDEGTHWMGEYTRAHEPVISLTRRPLSSATPDASVEQVRGSRVFTQDRLLPFDIRTRYGQPINFRVGMGEPRVFDFASLPET